MSSNILFDNLLITDDHVVAEEWAAVTYDLKRQQIDLQAVSFSHFISNISILRRFSSNILNVTKLTQRRTDKKKNRLIDTKWIRSVCSSKQINQRYNLIILYRVKV